MKSSAFDEGEFDEEKEERELEQLKKSKGYRPSTFILFQQFMWDNFSGPFKKKKGWRYVPPVDHFIKAREILDKMIEYRQIDLLEAFKITLFVYYAVYNSVEGTKQHRSVAA